MNDLMFTICVKSAVGNLICFRMPHFKHYSFSMFLVICE